MVMALMALHNMTRHGSDANELNWRALGDESPAEQSARRIREAELLAGMDAEPAEDSRMKGFQDNFASRMWIDHQAWLSQ